MNGLAGPITVRLIHGWVRAYTHGLPDDVRRRRRAELESDVWEQVHDSDEPVANQAFLGRFLRGIPADVWWRYRTLLDTRGAKQRSYKMSTLLSRGWWTSLSTVLGVSAGVLGALGLLLGDTSDGGQGLAINWTVSAILLLAGLVVLQHRPVAGSWIIIGSGALLAFSVVGIPIALVILGGGLWTGNLVLTEQAAAKLDLSPRENSVTEHWYRWLFAAAGLGVLGFLVLLIWPVFTPDHCTEFNPCWEDTLAWATWILSWMGGVATAAIGVALAAARFTRHHTRPA